MTHPAVEAVARAISKLSDCEYYPVDAYCNCRNHATAAIRALLDVPVSSGMRDVAYHQFGMEIPDVDLIWNAMLSQLVREIEGSGG